ncbi:glycosyltransferase family 2 protein [Geomesophilobacter sediminis]|uniref:Glycosyltransferase n=1 Tax=Geomesophilobacter sediminis TaxID=2798584 RepID=A0A8J7SAB8_9BACT|nr:glycosyltransferase [Geomesophilobacter sediminis]MBJ6727390.1 glycosyltransferase [Geomesophilobacter sediminis]
MDKVSVVITCYNYGKFVAEALASVRAQTYQNWECLVVDDGSTDNSREMIEYFTVNDLRFRYLHQENRGLSAARNRGISEATGELIQIIDADDLIEPGKLASQVRFLHEHPEVDLVYGECRFFSDENREERRLSMWGPERPWMPNVSGAGLEMIRWLVKMNIMVVSAPLVRRSTIIAGGNFDETLRSNEDWDLWLRCAIQGARFAYLSEPDTYTLIRYHPGSLSHNLPKMDSTSIYLHRKIHRLLPNRELKRQNRLKIRELRHHYLHQGFLAALEEIRFRSDFRTVARFLGFCAAKFAIRLAQRARLLLKVG